MSIVLYYTGLKYLYYEVWCINSNYTYVFENFNDILGTFKEQFGEIIKKAVIFRDRVRILVITIIKKFCAIF